MPIEKFYTKTFSIIRGTWSEDSEGFASSAPTTVGTFKGHLQQITPKLAQYLNLNFTTTYSIWAGGSTSVKVGDILLCDGIYYSVKEIQNNTLVGSNTHIEIIAERSDEYGS
jgi:hypothetical protein